MKKRYVVYRYDQHGTSDWEYTDVVFQARNKKVAIAEAKAEAKENPGKIKVIAEEVVFVVETQWEW